MYGRIPRRRVRYGPIASLIAWLCLALFGGAGAAAATTWVVDAAHPACSDSGPGDSSTPYCSIGAAAAVAAPGDSVEVHPARYREQVSAPSGAAGLPVAFLATGSGVRVIGTADLSGAALWSPAGGSVWSRPFDPPAGSPSPRQVFVDGTLLAAASSVAAMTPNTFFYDASTQLLYVDLGGDNPGDHAMEAGARRYGFDVFNRSHVVISGFELWGQETAGIRVRAATFVEVAWNQVSHSAVFGILLQDLPAIPPADPNDPSSGVGEEGHTQVIENRVSFAEGGGIRVRTSTQTYFEDNEVHDNGSHGMRLTGSSGNRIVHNEFRANGSPSTPFAVGLDLDDDSSDNVIVRNLSWGNFDSGFETAGSHRNLFARNVSHSNGDHGFDARGSFDPIYVSNTAYGNATDGYSLEGGSGGATYANNIGAQSGNVDLFVAADSVAGFSSDYDLFFRSGGGTLVRFANVSYATVADFSTATGHEAHGLDADPLFVDPGAGDLRIQLGPAVDSADAGAPGFMAPDRAMRRPLDIPNVADTGAGDPPYADRGAYEYVERAPRAVLFVTRGPGSLQATADASASSDDVGIESYLFDFGDGTPPVVVVSSASPVVVHTYASSGRYTVTVTVRDTSGFEDSASKQVRVR